MTSQLLCFRCFYAAGSWEKDTENRAAVTSLRSFLFRDDFSFDTFYAKLSDYVVVDMMFIYKV